MRTLTDLWICLREPLFNVVFEYKVILLIFPICFFSWYFSSCFYVIFFAVQKIQFPSLNSYYERRMHNFLSIVEIVFPLLKVLNIIKNRTQLSKCILQSMALCKQIYFEKIKIVITINIHVVSLSLRTLTINHWYLLGQLIIWGTKKHLWLLCLGLNQPLWCVHYKLSFKNNLNQCKMINHRSSKWRHSWVTRAVFLNPNSFSTWFLLLRVTFMGGHQQGWFLLVQWVSGI